MTSPRSKFLGSVEQRKVFTSYEFWLKNSLIKVLRILERKKKEDHDDGFENFTQNYCIFKYISFSPSLRVICEANIHNLNWYECGEGKKENALYMTRRQKNIPE